MPLPIDVNYKQMRFLRGLLMVFAYVKNGMRVN